MQAPRRRRTVKVLTIRQPWALLVALGVKTIETRSWSTKYRGPLTIHAGARKPRRIWVEPNGDPPAAVDLIAMGRHYDMWEDVNDPGSWAYDWAGPLGAIIATATLDDVVPICESCDNGDPFPQVFLAPKRPPLPRSTAPFPELVFFHEAMEEGRDVSDQLPYGDYSPGRWAWLLADIEPVDPPVPFRGGQGLSRSWASS